MQVGDEHLPKMVLSFILVNNMKNQILPIVLGIVCLGLVVAVVSIKKQAGDEKRKDTEEILDLSNKVVKATDDLGEQQRVNSLLEQTNELRKTQLVALTNQLVAASNSLVQTATSLKSTQDQMTREIAQRDAKITDLESQNAALDQRANDLTASLTNLTAQIDDTKRKLAASEGDKAFLEKELKRMMTEKAELERQFNDISVLRAQVAKLREEMNVSRRLDWMRRGVFATADQKGAQQLIQSGPASRAVAPQSTQHYDLNVEVNADGSIKVLPPITNAPPSASPNPGK